MFNRTMRLYADQKGFTLSDHAMIPYTKTAEGMAKCKKGKSVTCETEESVFEFLDLPYKLPKDREL